MHTDLQIEQFLEGTSYAVVGASTDREKYGNKVLRAYLQDGRRVFPVHPSADEIEGLKAYPSLADIPEPVHGVSIITPPTITEAIVAQAGALKLQHLWLQPGAENERALDAAHAHQMNVIAGGPCILVILGFRES